MGHSVSTQAPSEITEYQRAIDDARDALAKNAGARFEESYEQLCRIGFGSFARVYLCAHRTTRKQYAARMVPKVRAGFDAQQQEFVKQLAIMRLLRDHPAVVQVIEAFDEERQFVTILEYCEGGPLFEHLVSKGHLGEREAAIVMMILLNGLSYWRSQNICHRDLKLENLVMARPGMEDSVKVIDWDTAALCLPSQHLTDKIGSVHYAAPEILAGEYGLECDVWSAGIILYTLLTGRPPFTAEDDMEVYRAIQHDAVPYPDHLWCDVSPEAQDVVRAMLNKDYRHRAAPGELLHHPWFKAALQVNSPYRALAPLARLRSWVCHTHLRQLVRALLISTLAGSDIAAVQEALQAAEAEAPGPMLPLADLLSTAMTQAGLNVTPELRDEMNQLCDVAPASPRPGTLHGPPSSAMQSYRLVAAALILHQKMMALTEALQEEHHCEDVSGVLLNASQMCALLPPDTPVSEAEALIKLSGLSGVKLGEVYPLCEPASLLHLMCRPDTLTSPRDPVVGVLLDDSGRLLR